MGAPKRWIATHPLVALITAFLLGGGAGGAAVVTTAVLKADLEAANEQAVTELAQARQSLSELTETNDALAKKVIDYDEREESSRRKAKRLRSRLAALRDQLEAGAEGTSSSVVANQVLCDPGGCENALYSPNPTYATYCDQGATFAYEGQCSYGD